MEPITRKQALEQGLPRYFTGKPCKRGHVSERQTANKTCLACKNDLMHSARIEDPEKYRERDRLRHGPKRRQQKRESWARHAESHLERDRKRYQESERKKQVTARSLRWKKENPHRVNTAIGLRRASMKVADLSPEDATRNAAIYKAARLLTDVTGVVHHVDHHIPIKLGGKHVPSNLWIITAEENLSKGAKMPL